METETYVDFFQNKDTIENNNVYSNFIRGGYKYEIDGGFPGINCESVSNTTPENKVNELFEDKERKIPFLSTADKKSHVNKIEDDLDLEQSGGSEQIYVDRNIIINTETESPINDTINTDELSTTSEPSQYVDNNIVINTEQEFSQTSSFSEEVGQTGGNPEQFSEASTEMPDNIEIIDLAPKQSGGNPEQFSDAATSTEMPDNIEIIDLGSKQSGGNPEQFSDAATSTEMPESIEIIDSINVKQQGVVQYIQALSVTYPNLLPN